MSLSFIGNGVKVLIEKAFIENVSVGTVYIGPIRNNYNFTFHFISFHG